MLQIVDPSARPRRRPARVGLNAWIRRRTSWSTASACRRERGAADRRLGRVVDGTDDFDSATSSPTPPSARASRWSTARVPLERAAPSPPSRGGGLLPAACIRPSLRGSSRPPARCGRALACSPASPACCRRTRSSELVLGVARRWPAAAMFDGEQRTRSASGAGACRACGEIGPGPSARRPPHGRRRSPASTRPHPPSAARGRGQAALGAAACGSTCPRCSTSCSPRYPALRDR